MVLFSRTGACFLLGTKAVERESSSGSWAKLGQVIVKPQCGNPVAPRPEGRGQNVTKADCLLWILLR